MRVTGAWIFVSGLAVGLFVARPSTEPVLAGAPSGAAPAEAAPAEAAPAAHHPPTTLDDTTAPATSPPSGGSAPRQDTRIGAHLRVAPALWARTLASARGRAPAALVGELEAHVSTLPATDGARLPPRDAVDRYLERSHALLERLAQAGVDAAELSVTIDALRRPAAVRSDP